MSQRLSSVLLLPALVAAGCAAQRTGVGLTTAEQEKLKRHFVGSEFALAQSLYTTDFFGDPNRLFADPRPFESLSLFHHDGTGTATGLPGPEIVPAGTMVRVVNIVPPIDPLVAAFDVPQSQLLPTAHTWVVLERSEPGASRMPLVLVLARRLPDADALTEALQARLKSEQWVSQWLTQREPLVLANINRKEPSVGMSWAELNAALGEPKNSADFTPEGLLPFVADYGDLQVKVEGGRVRTIVSRKAEAMIAQRRARESAEVARRAAQERLSEEEKRQRAERRRTGPRDLGLTVTDVDPQVAMALGLPGGQGCYVTGLEPDGEAVEAGLSANDVIIEVDNIPIEGADFFRRLVVTARPTQKIDITFVRRTTRMLTSVGLDAGPPLVAPARPSRAASTESPATAANDARASGRPLRDPNLAWWQDQQRLSVAARYQAGFSDAREANRLSRDVFGPYTRDQTSMFGFTHGPELTVEYASRFVLRAQLGLGYFSQGGALELDAPVTNSNTGEPAAPVASKVTGSAWMLTLPILLGGRLPLLDGRLVVAVDVGAEVMAAARLRFVSEQVSSPAMAPSGMSAGFMARGGAAWQLTPALAITAEVTARTVESGELVMQDDVGGVVVDHADRAIHLSLRGASLALGIVATLF